VNAFHQRGVEIGHVLDHLRDKVAVFFVDVREFHFALFHRGHVVAHPELVGALRVGEKVSVRLLVEFFNVFKPRRVGFEGSGFGLTHDAVHEPSQRRKERRPRMRSTRRNQCGFRDRVRVSQGFEIERNLFFEFHDSTASKISVNLTQHESTNVGKVFGTGFGQRSGGNRVFVAAFLQKGQ